MAAGALDWATAPPPADPMIGVSCSPCMRIRCVVGHAGQRPLVPRRFSAEEIAASALEIRVRYVVLGERRETTARVVEQLTADFEFMELPPEIAASAEDRGILVLRRK